MHSDIVCRSDPLRAVNSSACRNGSEDPLPKQRGVHTEIERIAQTLTRTWRLGLADERPVQVRAMRSFPVRAFALH